MLSKKAVLGTISVSCVARNRVSEVSQVPPQLVFAAGFGFQLKKAEACGLVSAGR